MEDVGIIFVHGIGEQKRFEFLNEHTHNIVKALQHQDGLTVTVDIRSAEAAAFQGQQDSWANAPGSSVTIFTSKNGELTRRLHLHEVWWTDINETYSLAKQLRFWLWGLAIWAYPSSKKSKSYRLKSKNQKGISLAGNSESAAPDPQKRSLVQTFVLRSKLWAVCTLFLLAGTPIGILAILAERVFNLRLPQPIRVLTNYLSGVKLFIQRHRLDGCFPGNEDDFIDTIGEPPRVSARRRMIRVIASVALANYDRWYVLAHSQGTVLAFNGLMEGAYAWPGYLEQAQWEKLVAANLAGPACGYPPAVTETMPRRPAWAGSADIVYRDKVFAKFRGILTFGSPIEKFATFWPNRVPVSRVEVFPAGARWINVFDPRDPISGIMSSYKISNFAQACPPPEDIGYASGPILLAAHLTYLKWKGEGCVADGVAQWLLNDNAVCLTEGKPGKCPRFKPGGAMYRRRRNGSFLQWGIVYAAAALLGGITLQAARYLTSSFLSSYRRGSAQRNCMCRPVATSPQPVRSPSIGRALLDTQLHAGLRDIVVSGPLLLRHATCAVVVAGATTALAGWICRKGAAGDDWDPPPPNYITIPAPLPIRNDAGG